MHKARTRLAAASAAAVLLLAPLSACGGGDDTKDSGSKSPGSSSSSSSSSGDHGDALTKDNFAKTVSEATLDAGSAHMTMEMGAQGSGEGDFVYEDGKSSSKMELTAMGQSMKMILVDGVFYMQAKGLSPEGKWARIDKSTPGIGPMLDQMTNMTPDKQIESMAKGLKDFKHIGSEKIDGDDTEKYEVTVDAAKMLETMGQTAPPSGTPQEITYFMYLDEDNRPRRISMDVSGQKINIDMTDWGKDVEIEAPAKGDVVDFKMPGTAPAPAQ